MSNTLRRIGTFVGAFGGALMVAAALAGCGSGSYTARDAYVRSRGTYYTASHDRVPSASLASVSLRE